MDDEFNNLVSSETKTKNKNKKDKTYFDSDRKNYQKEIIAFGGIFVIGMMIFASGSVDILFSGFNVGGGMQGAISPIPIQISSPQTYQGELSVKITHRDALDFTESRQEGTDIITTYYRQNPNGEFYPMGFGDDTVVIVDNNYKIYVAIEAVEDSEIFIAPKPIQSANPRIYDFDFFDIDRDGLQEWVFFIDATDIREPMGGQVRPAISLFSYFFDDQSESQLLAPVEKIHSGSSWIRWQLNVPEESTLVVNTFRVDIGSSDQTRWNDKYSFIQIPNIGQVQFNEMDVVRLGDKTSYVYDIGNDISSANYIVTPQNGNPIHEIPVMISTNGIEENLDITLILTVANPNQEFSDLKHTVTLIPVKKV